jgi:intracellular septation protein
MQMFIDFLPVLVFFGVYFTYGIYAATAAIIAVMVVQIAVTWLVKRTVSKMLLISGSLVVVFGGITLVLREPLFIQLKLTVVNALFALAFLISHFVGSKTLTERILGHALEAPATLWRQLNLMWIANFSILAIANVYVIYNYDMDTWAIFKTAGTIGLTLLTVIAQAVWIAVQTKVGAASGRDLPPPAPEEKSQ